jgi:CHASE1-domain containing sensor protein
MFAVFFISGVSVLVLAGWFFNIDLLLRLLPFASKMNPMIAVSFLLFAIGIFFKKKFNGYVAVFAGFMLFIISVLRIISIYGLILFSPDLMLFHSDVLAELGSGRMSLVVAFGFLFLGVSLLSFKFASFKRMYVTDVVSLLVLSLASIGLVAYCFDLQSILQSAIFSSVAIHTLILFFVAGVLLLGRIDKNWKALSFKSGFMISCLLVVVFLLTLFLATIVEKFLLGQIEARFIEEANKITADVENRYDVYATALEGGGGLFAASEKVYRDEWAAYVESLDLQKNYQGVQGLGYAKLVSRKDLKNYTNAVRAEGFSSFTVFPEGERDLYSVVTYIEPFDERNQKSFGFDALQDPTRRFAMDRARDTGVAQISGKVKLIQEIDVDVQEGFLMYVPVYKNGMPVRTVEERQAAISGYVFSPFRAGDFVHGTVMQFPEGLHFVMNDGITVTGENLLYMDKDCPSLDVFNDVGNMKMAKTIYVNGHPVTLSFAADSYFDQTKFADFAALFVVSIGFLVNIFIAGMFCTLIYSRQRSIDYADELTKDLQKVNLRFKLATRAAQIGVWEWDLVENSLIASDQFYALFNARPKDFEKAYEGWVRYIHPDDKERGKEEVRLAISGKKDFDTVLRTVQIGGEVRYIRYFGEVGENKVGKPIGMVGVSWDITAQMRAEGR